MKTKLFSRLAGSPITALFLGLILGVCLFGTSGCATSSAVRTQGPAVLTQVLISNTVPAVLNANPAYEVKLLLLADGVDLVFAKGTLTPEDVNAYLDALHFDPQSRLLIGSAILDLWTLYGQTAGIDVSKIANISDPKFVAMLTSFKDGIREGVRRYHVFKPAASSALAK